LLFVLRNDGAKVQRSKETAKEFLVFFRFFRNFRHAGSKARHFSLTTQLAVRRQRTMQDSDGLTIRQFVDWIKPYFFV
jgi:hypothetical protein